MLTRSRRMSRMIQLMMCAVALVALAPGAWAQGPANLAQENEELKQRVETLEKQLEQARERIAALNEEMARLREQLAEGGGARARPGSPAGGASSGEVPSDPMASPESLFETLRESYVSNFGGEPYDTRADQNRLRRMVSSWVRDMQREHRGNIKWHVRILDASQADERGGPVRFQVVDPATGADIGEPTEALFPARMARRIDSATPDEVWVMEGRTSARPMVNRTRIEEDDDPQSGARYIGPFAEFAYELAIESIEPAS